ncbi:MAG: nitrous oxide reductase family maturation protein NosD [Acidobacteriota bacterium]
MRTLLWQVAVSAALAAGLSSVTQARTLCVNPAGTSGCYSTINAAVGAASDHDTIKVKTGTYAEYVVIGKSLSIIAEDRKNTIIDASGQPNGFYVDGIDHRGLREVVINGFTVKNANFEGILVTNAAYITIWGNTVTQNDKSLNPSDLTCPGIPAFETAEGFDCGEGIHLSGVHHSTIAENYVAHNAGGILLSDDTGATHHILVSGNTVLENPFDCGITLASHPPATITGATAPLGVFNNTIAGNESTRNGLAVGEGAGVGIFDSVPGAKNYGNVVIANKLTNNGLPGVALHSHTPGQNLNNNVIVANQISGNHADSDDAATPGPTGINIFGVSPITGTIVSQNIITDEAVDVAVNTPGYVDIHLNNLEGEPWGLANLGTGQVDATENWWGCAAGAGAPGCSAPRGPNVIVNPSLTKPF